MTPRSNLQKEVCEMADKEKYIIKVEGKLVEVTPDVYDTYFRMERQERGQEEKKQRNEVMSYRKCFLNSEGVSLVALLNLLIKLEQSLNPDKKHASVTDLPSCNIICAFAIRIVVI